MTEPTRLFDCIECQLQKGPDYTMMAVKENGSWKEYSVQEVANIVNKLSAGLLKIGFGKKDNTPEGRDKIAVISKNRPEWLMLDLAVQQIGAVLTPVYPTINELELEFILKDAAVEIIFVNDAALAEKVNNIKANLPGLQRIFSFEKTSNVKYWEEILTAEETYLQEVKSISEKIKYEDLATIIYTSGTTGKPKGVMLSHKNILSNVLDSMPCFPPGDHLRALSFLPLNHIFERMVSYLYLFKGTSIFFAESMETIGDNLKEVTPNLFTTVPRLLEKVYERIMQKGEELSGIKRKLFFWAHSLAEKFEINKNKGVIYKLQLSIANKLIFSKWREALGNELICIVSGGAACQVRLIRIFTAAKIPIMEGYGLTETSPVISVNRFQEEGRMFGTVGPLIKNVEVKIAVDGEILCKGPNVMMGYYKRPDLTAESMEDGWFKTGDIGMLINNRFLKITDRKKEMFKTSGGKYVAPVAIELKMKECPYVENIMVTGEGEKYVGALIIPAFNNLKEWAKNKNITYTDNEKLLQNEQVKELYKTEVENYNRQFNHVEQIKKFELLAHEWSVDTGEMTPKLSLKRKVIMEKYKEAIRRIYE
ncbi:long-chain fatty acid--CoA ligase [Ginsengibacter hankyongi]|uniref:Long-chain fatty acid--CoA ligase n=1 Tax=Ginsengibacter hankyongi TaxID=2607284 RepID=A0A5J5IMC4_9BACT|nr:long-chain fatty acid--CoA ligase [Ginsengibacter hankyongi]KAA9042205.1 long-chain fatty acid--CoA ligase [Ginsengibacter hankyongi]